jgi:hypothetical protein
MNFYEFLGFANAVSNLIICFAVSTFYILLYTNQSSIVHKWQILQHWFVKLALLTVATSSAWNGLIFIANSMIEGEFVKIGVTPLGEIALNIGLAVMFSWMAYFHKYHFLQVAPSTTRKTRSRAPVRKTSTRRTK